jgi:SAM-dependent methyltransferase/uncharacterized protein YbaR (Trm112 family)
MRADLLAILRCPHCKNHPLSLEINRSNEQEIREGAVCCPACANRFPILNGVVELLAGLDAGTLAERNSRVRKRDWDIERQRPYINDKPTHPWIWPAFAANVNQGLSLVELKNKRVLDVGAATCWSTRMICERGALGIALDISTSMLEDGEAQFKTGVLFDRVAANMSVLPFQDASLHVIFFSATLHHTSLLESVFQEVHRCLAPGGQAVLVNEPVAGVLHRSANFGEQDRREGMNEHIYSLSEYRQAALRSGLQPEVHFPDSLRLQLDGKLPRPATPGLALVSVFWKWLPCGLKKHALEPGHRWIGLDLVMLLAKPG